MLTAIRIPAAEAAPMLARAREDDRVSDTRVAQAEAMVETVREEARSQIDAYRSRVASITDGTLSSYIDAKRIEAEAIAAATLIDSSSRARDHFEQVTPWLMDLVRDTVERIVGTLEDADLVSRLVAEAVASHRDASALTVAAHPSALALVERARAAWPGRFEAVAAIRSDQALAADELRIEGTGGTIDATFRTQLDRFLDALRKLDPQE